MSFIKNSILNFSGQAIPAFIAIPVFGILARNLGVEGFGLFTLILAVVGYAGIFDVGLTRAVIREVSHHRDDHHQIEKIISSAVLCVFVLGGLGFLLIFIGNNQLIKVLKVTDSCISEMHTSLLFVALSIPILLVNQVLLSSWEGLERFGLRNIQRLISSILMLLFPLLFVFVSNSLSSAVLGILISRVVSLGLTVYLHLKKFNFELSLPCGIVIKKLLKFGGWMAVSNLISPVLVYFDRFILSNALGAATVSYYSGPSEMVSRLGAVPASLVRVLFPMLSRQHFQQEARKYKSFCYVSMGFICSGIWLVGSIFAEPFMRLWLGAEYAVQSAGVFCVLLVGFFVNAFAQIHFASIQAKGYSKLTAYVHLAEVIPYVALLYYLLSSYSLLGVAIAWSARCVVDYFILLLVDLHFKGEWFI